MKITTIHFTALSQQQKEKVGFPIGIPLRAIAQSCAQLSGIARNCAELRGIARSLQGLQLRASKIHLRWKPLEKDIAGFFCKFILPFLDMIFRFL